MTGVIEKAREFIKKIPIFSKIVFILTPVCAAVHFIAVKSPVFADFFNIRISQFFRAILAAITSAIPVSLAEILIYSSPLLVAFVVTREVRRPNKPSGQYIRLISILLAIVMSFYVLFVMTFACGYRGRSLAEKMNLEENGATGEELYRTVNWLSHRLTVLVPEIEYTADDGSSVMPYSFSELNKKLLDAYDKTAEQYDFINNFYSRTKEVQSGQNLSKLHILGIYTYFTGEANVNTVPPDYSVPYTMAHEMAHQRGIAPENEANFIAFIVCMNSDDPYIQYSGYLNMFEYVLSSLGKSGYDCTVTCSKEVYADMSAYAEYYAEYADSKVGEVSRKMNDAYLKNQGTVGRASYGLVTDLAVSYYLRNIEPLLSFSFLIPE